MRPGTGRDERGERDAGRVSRRRGRDDVVPVFTAHIRPVQLELESERLVRRPAIGEDVRRILVTARAVETERQRIAHELERVKMKANDVIANILSQTIL